ncbi:MAG: hypothetical protein P8X82_09025, partial [Gemmatimonadales bacterium]
DPNWGPGVLVAEVEVLIAVGKRNYAMGSCESTSRRLKRFDMERGRSNGERGVTGQFLKGSGACGLGSVRGSDAGCDIVVISVEDLPDLALPGRFPHDSKTGLVGGSDVFVRTHWWMSAVGHTPDRKPTDALAHLLLAGSSSRQPDRT